MRCRVKIVSNRSQQHLPAKYEVAKSEPRSKGKETCNGVGDPGKEAETANTGLRMLRFPSPKFLHVRGRLRMEL